MRENKEEIELAKKGKLPKLLELSDIKGDFHIHSSYHIEPSHDMGQNSMKEIIQKAKELKYDYLRFSEHNPSLSRHNKSQIYYILKQKNNFIEQLKYKYKKVIHVFSLLEIDILPSGNLSVDSKNLELLYTVIV